VRGKCLISAGLVAGLLVLAAGAGASTLKITRPPAGVEARKAGEARAEKWLRAPVKDAASKRQVLRAARKAESRALAGTQDVLRLAAIRVEFASVPDPAGISGAAGRFDLSDTRSTVFIDPSPHGRKYFSRHMESLANYFRAMSYGKLEIQGQVFPLAEDVAYELEDIGKYNPEGRVGSWSWENLEVFFRDAIQAADQDPDLRFADFDAFVIFHAGSDWQNDLRGDSPYDIPSFFISLAESIAVDDSTSFVYDGSVVPETSSQDGYLNGINGVLAHEVGHQLGLPDLYDTQSGLSAVGYWDLMDFGSGVGVVIADPRTLEPYYVTGILPGSLSAWSKTYLGWVEPDTVETAGDFVLEATELQGGSPNREALLVRLNSYEYFLVENRQCDLDGDSTGILLADPSEDSTGVIMGPINQDREFNFEYDWPLPGSGLLVWHIDDVMVAFGSPYDVVNGFPRRRGVSLAEADGIPDLGNYNSFYFLGSPFDPFYRGNNDRFADDTYPGTQSTTGCHSHVVMENISEPGLTMGLSVSNSWMKPGLPVALGDSLRFGVPSLLVADLDGGQERAEVVVALKRAVWTDSIKVVGGDSIYVEYVDYDFAELHGFEFGAAGEVAALPGWPRRLHGVHPREIVGANLDGEPGLEIVVGDETGRVYAFSPDGSPYFENADSLGAFAVFPGMAGAAVAADLDNDGSEELVIATPSGLYGISGRSRAAAEVLFTVDSPEVLAASSQPVVVDCDDGHAGPEIIWYRAGDIELVSAEGIAFRQLAAGPLGSPGQAYLAAADLDRAEDEAPELLIVMADGWAGAIDLAGSPVPGWSKRVCDQVVGPPAIADLNGDGYLEVVLSDRGNRTRAFTWNGSRVDGWPNDWYGCALPDWDADFHVADTTIAVPSAVLADLGSTGQMGVYQGSLFECVVGWGPGGGRLAGLPLTMGGGCSALAIGDIDGDRVLDLVAGGGDGNLYAYSSGTDETDEADSPWRASYFDRTRNCVYPARLLPAMPTPGTDLLVARSFHAFPNPVTGDGASFAFTTETGGRATVEIFDVTGRRVKTAAFDAVANVERPMDLSALANGLYVCRLRIEGDGRSASDFFKLAIKR